MNTKTFVVLSMTIALPLAGIATADEPDRKSGTIIGELKSKKDTKDGKNTIIEVLSPGEEKPRSYHVMWDPAVKGPIPSVLKDVRAANVGDRVEFEWVGGGHGPAIKTFKVFKKGTGSGDTPKPVHPEPHRYHAALHIHMDGDKIRAAGINRFDVAEALNAFLDRHPKFKLSDLQSVKIKAGNGKEVPLRDLLIIDVEFDRPTRERK